MPGGAITGSQTLATSDEHPALAGGCFGDTAPSRNPVGSAVVSTPATSTGRAA